VTAAEIRLPFKRFFEPSLPKLNILSYQEMPSATEIQNHAIIVFPDFALQNMMGQGAAAGVSAETAGTVPASN
ncbi:MAG: hypothetical protein AAGB46_15790, partial [Verrucomicrobiota bacterium]